MTTTLNDLAAAMKAAKAKHDAAEQHHAAAKQAELDARNNVFGTWAEFQNARDALMAAIESGQV